MLDVPLKMFSCIKMKQSQFLVSLFVLTYKRCTNLLTSKKKSGVCNDYSSVYRYVHNSYNTLYRQGLQ